MKRSIVRTGSLTGCADRRPRGRSTGLRHFGTLVAVSTALLSTGCATVATIQTVDEHSARVYSGTRLDVAAIGGGPRSDRTFRTSPPPYPWLDLPFSFVLDTVMLPLTLGISGTFGR